MLTLTIENKKIEDIFINEFHSNKEKFFEFIQNSYEKVKNTQDAQAEIFLQEAQESAMQSTWDNDDDKVWDAL